MENYTRKNLRQAEGPGEQPYAVNLTLKRSNSPVLDRATVLPPNRNVPPRPRLLNGACDGREYIVRVGTDQPNRTYHYDQDHRQHNRIFRDILPLFFAP